jgi:hypothetical protein
MVDDNSFLPSAEVPKPTEKDKIFQAMIHESADPIVDAFISILQAQIVKKGGL